MEVNSTRRGLTKVTKRPPIDIQFHNISYNKGRKQILKKISGKFCSGNLIGILGSSGAGKTTLLNVLAGHLQSGVSGEIYVNDEPRVMKKFHKVSSYIMQEDVVQPFLTVNESITVAANLKIDSKFSNEDKKFIMEEVLSVMGLQACAATRVENLSGGEKKRFIIALELMSNPPLIFLDEPTTGLDDYAMRNCMQLLKSCSTQGRTIICTIHQPSDSLFKLFDSIYFMADGYCIYNGTVPDLVPFLSSCGYICPTNYNPADYIIEIAHFDYCGILKLKDAISNGKIYCSESGKLNLLSTVKICSDDIYDFYSETSDFPANFWKQFAILCHRKFLQMKRNKSSVVWTIGVNILIGLMLGLTFYQVGSKGDRVPANVKYFFCVVMHFLFTYFMAPILIYPFEVKLLEREYYNRWYSLKAYYAATVLTLLPVMIVGTIFFATIGYTLSGQPLELDRFLRFNLICLLMAVTSQRLGYAIGSLFNPAEGACVGSVMLSFLILISIYNVGYGDVTHVYMKMLMWLSFPYHAFIGIGTSVLENRGYLDCEEMMICYFGDPNFVMIKMGWEGKTTMFQALYLLVFTIIHQVFSYLCLKIRVSHNLAPIRNVLAMFKV